MFKKIWLPEWLYHLFPAIVGISALIGLIVMKPLTISISVVLSLYYFYVISRRGSFKFD